MKESSDCFVFENQKNWASETRRGVLKIRNGIYL